jgi:spermidine synthase
MTTLASDPGVVLGTDRHVYRVAERLAAQTTPYQDVLVVRTHSFGRALFLDGAIQSSECDEHIYHEALVHPAMTAHPGPRRVLILGGGEGASLREVLRHRTVLQATMVDIDAGVVGLCRQHLPEWSSGALTDRRAAVVIHDGKQWLERSRERFDVIVVDLTDQIELGPSFALYTQGFYRTLDAHLNEGGMLVMQAGELSAGDYFSHCSIRRTLATVFEHVVSYTQSIPSFFAQWSWIVASQHVPDALLDAGRVDARLSTRVQGPLEFYDGAAHRRMFALTRDLDRHLAHDGTVVRDIASFRRALDASRPAAASHWSHNWLSAK